MAIAIDNDGHPVPDGKGKRWWTRLSPEERRLHTDWRFDAGHKNSDVMEALALSVGTVSGIKRIWRERREEARDIAPAPAPPNPPPPKPPQPPVPKPPAPAPAPPVVAAKEKVAPSRVVSTKLTTDWRLQCGHKDEKGHQCGYKHLPDSASCGRPGHDK